MNNMENIDINKLCEMVLKELNCADKKLQIPVEASGRHVHLSKAHVEELFGKGYEMTILRELSQPGQYLYKEKVRLIGPKGVIENVAILGPARDNTQVELSLTDSRILGVKAPVRNSGDTAGSGAVYIASGDKLVQIEEGTIISNRHIHMSDEDARNFGVKDKDLVNVRVMGSRALIFEEVLIRVNPNFRLSMHIDYDEANACGLNKDTVGEIYV